MSAPAEPMGTVEQALRHAAAMLESQPDITAEQAAEVLKVVPGHPVATLLLGAGRRAMGDAEGALPLIEPLVKAHPQWPTPHFELGLVLGALGHGEAAIEALRRAVALEPDMPDAWRALGEQGTSLRAADGTE